MIKLQKFCAAIFIIFLSALIAFPQIGSLPKFKKGETYTKVRAGMLKASWKPFHAADSDECAIGDARCAGRPEMHACAGTGLGNCDFLWKRTGKTVAIFTVGENTAVYNGYKFQK